VDDVIPLVLEHLHPFPGDFEVEPFPIVIDGLVDHINVVKVYPFLNIAQFLVYGSREDATFSFKINIDDSPLPCRVSGKEIIVYIMSF
jgi:hypothetical protein